MILPGGLGSCTCFAHQPCSRPRRSPGHPRQQNAWQASPTLVPWSCSARTYPSSLCASSRVARLHSYTPRSEELDEGRLIRNHLRRPSQESKPFLLIAALSQAQRWEAKVRALAKLRSLALVTPEPEHRVRRDSTRTARIAPLGPGG